MTQITVTRALSELGTIGDRIEKAIAGGKFIAVVKGDTNKPLDLAYPTLQDLNTAMQSSFDTVESLIKRQTVLKTAVLLSNAQTKVIISNKEMTVAEAIQMKTVAEHQKHFLLTLKSQLTLAARLASDTNKDLEDRIERALAGIYAAGKEAPSEEQRNNVAKPLKKEHEARIVSGKQDLSSYIRKLESDLSDFLSECDYALSEINCKTIIDVE